MHVWFSSCWLTPLHVSVWPVQKAVAEQLSRAQKATSRLKRSGAKGSSGKAATTAHAAAVVDMHATEMLQQAAVNETKRWGAAVGAGGVWLC